MNTYDKMGDIIPTGINQLDALIEGGLHKGELCLIAARSGIEKTTFATHIAGNIQKCCCGMRYCINAGAGKADKQIHKRGYSGI